MMNMTKIILPALLIFSLTVNCQTIFPVLQNSIKSFDITPVSDSEIMEADSLGNTGLIPYDFYAALNCEVYNTIDTIFEVLYNDTISISVISNLPCYVCIYGNQDLPGNNNQYLFIPVREYSNMKFRKTLTFTSNDLSSGFNRIFITRENACLKKNTSTASIIDPITPLDQLDNNTNSINSTINTLDPVCSLTIHNSGTNETVVKSGLISGNMYMLSGGVYNPSLAPGITYEDAVFPDEPFSIFTTQSTTDVEMFLIDNNNCIIGHNNDYDEESGHNWNKESRIDLTGNERLKAILLIPHKTYIDQEDDYYNDPDYILTDSTINGKTDLYLGCKFFSMPNISYYFPNLYYKDRLVADKLRYYYGYNCHGWTAYPTQNLLRQSILGGIHTAESIAYYLCHYYGFTEEGVTEENSDVDIWEHNGYATHTSVKSYSGAAGGNSYGYAWESKLGSNERIMHPRYSLTNYDESNVYAYGHVVKHLKKRDDIEEICPVFKNITFTESEHSKISLMVESASIKDVRLFNEYYKRIKNEVACNCINNLGLLYIYNQDFKQLVKAAKESLGLVGLLLKKLEEKDEIAPYLFYYYMEENFKEYIVKMLEYETKDVYSKEGVIILHNDLSEATLLAKAYLSGSYNYIHEISLDNLPFTTGSNALSINANNGSLKVMVFVSDKGIATLKIENLENGSNSIIFNNSFLNEGLHQFEYNLNNKGIYAVILSLNGKTYIQKIIL